MTKISDFCQKNLFFSDQFIGLSEKLGFLEKNLVFFILSEKTSISAEKSDFLYFLKHPVFSSENCFFFNKKKTAGFSGRRTRLAPDIIGLSQKVDFSNFGQNVKMGCHRLSLLI